MKQGLSGDAKALVESAKRNQELRAEIERLRAVNAELVAALERLTDCLGIQGDELAEANIAYLPEWNAAIDALEKARSWEDCDACGMSHPEGFKGDCRDNRTRR